jgi:hypothetical protein
MARRSSYSVHLKRPSRRKRIPEGAPPEIQETYRRSVPGTLIPKKFLRPLGYVVAWSSVFETAIDLAIFKLFGFNHPDKGNIISARFNTLGNKLNVLKVVADIAIQNQKAKAAFKTIMKDADAFIATRNKLLHGRWIGTTAIGTKNTAAIKLSYKAQDKLTFSHTKFTAETIKQSAESALGITDRLSAFFIDHPDWDA